MNKFVKISVIILGIIIVTGSAIYAKLFIIGNSSYQDISIEKVSMGSSISIDAEFLNSKRAYKSFSYTLVDSELYVKVNSVMISSKYNKGEFSLNIPVNGRDVNNIHLTDDKTTKVIYSKQVCKLEIINKI